MSVCPWNLRSAFQAVWACRIRYKRMPTVIPMCVASHLPWSSLAELLTGQIDAQTSQAKNAYRSRRHGRTGDVRNAGGKIDRLDDPHAEILPVLASERAEQMAVGARMDDRRPGCMKNI